MNQQLINYIKKTLKAGFSREKIAEVLWKAGWTKEDVDEAFKFLQRTARSKTFLPRWLSYLILVIVVVIFVLIFLFFL